MFFGTTPAPVRDYLASELQRTKSKRVFEPCAGNFVLSFVCGALDKTIEVRSGDVSLYSVAIGCGLASKDIGIKLKDEYLETYPFFKGKSSPIEVAATVIMWAELAKNLERKHIAYYASLARDLTENAEKYFVEILGKIKKAKESLGNFSFTAQDACITIQDAGEGDFVLYDPSSTPGKYWTISGHHRIEGAIKANVRWILVMVINVADMDQLRAKQLSHNAIEGEDDDIVLQKMYEALKSIQAKLYSGLQDRLQPVSVVSLSFRAGSFQSFTVAFLPGDIADYDAALELVKNLPVTASSVVRVGELDSYEMFSKAIRQVKHVDNVKASGTALSVLIQRGLERLAQVKEEQKAAESKDPVVEEIGVE